MLFFISPAYRVPPMSTAFRAKFSTMKVVVRVPCRAGSAGNSGAWYTVHSGSNWASVSARS